MYILYFSNGMVVGVCYIESSTVTQHALRGVKLTASLIPILETFYTTAIHNSNSSWVGDW